MHYDLHFVNCTAASDVLVACKRIRGLGALLQLGEKAPFER